MGCNSGGYVQKNRDFFSLNPSYDTYAQWGKEGDDPVPHYFSDVCPQTTFKNSITFLVNLKFLQKFV